MLRSLKRGGGQQWYARRPPASAYLWPAIRAMTTGKARYLGASSMRAWQFATIAKAISHPDQYYSRLEAPPIQGGAFRVATPHGRPRQPRHDAREGAGVKPGRYAVGPRAGP